MYNRSNGRETVVKLADHQIAWKALRRLRRAGLPVRRLFTDRWRETEIGLEPTVSVARIRPYLHGLPVRAESTGFAIHLIEEGIGKLSTLRRALRLLDLGPKDCLIAGDGDNDVDMLNAAGWAVSFPSASARARHAADYVAHAPYARGFVEAVKASDIAIF